MGTRHIFEITGDGKSHLSSMGIVMASNATIAKRKFIKEWEEHKIYSRNIPCNIINEVKLLKTIESTSPAQVLYFWDGDH